MKKISLLFGIILAIGLTSCTKDFVEINTDPNLINNEEVLARNLITPPQLKLYAPDQFYYWRAHLIHFDRFAGQFCFGNNYSWWDDGLSYTYHSGYTDATWDWLDGYFGLVDTYLKLTDVGGSLENPKVHATALIIKCLYFQTFTDVFGEIPYSETGNVDVMLPKFDTQKEIYQGLIADLDKAMQLIGDATVTGEGVQNVGTNDLYFGGDMQKWKKLANSLKLRLAMRAYGATGADFAQAAITSALNAPLISETSDNAMMKKDNVISKWSSDSYGNIVFDYGGLHSGANWTVSEVMINYLRNNNDPRLSKYARPAEGGSLVINKPTDAAELALFPKRLDFIFNKLQQVAGADVTKTEDATSVTITLAANKYYIGQPVRLNGQIKSLVCFEFFSAPAQHVIQRADGSAPIREELIFSSAETHFLKAEAIVKGIATGDANVAYQTGIRRSMESWGVAEGDITTFLANQAMAQLTGTNAEKLEKIGVQRWLAAYTDGAEAWSIVRKTGYPTQLAQGVNDNDIFSSGDLNGAYPSRMRYGTSAASKNGANLTTAIGRQGADLMNTKLWWNK